MAPPGAVRWSLHDAMKRGHTTTGTICEPVDEYRNVDRQEVAFVLSRSHTELEKPHYAQSTIMSYQPYALEQPTLATETHNLPKQLETRNPLMMEIDPDPLGQGNFGACYKALITKYASETGEFELMDKKVAFKQMNMKDSLGSDTLYKRELEMLRSLDHENIVKYFFACPCTCTEDDTQKKVDGIVMELCSGTTLRSYLKKFQKQHHEGQRIQLISMIELMEIFNQSAKGLEHMHSRKIIHCDVKLDNIMWDDSVHVLKFIDFGLAFNASGNSPWRRCGTFDYLAPECFSNKVYDSSDIWALGIMMSCLILQSSPYEMHDQLKVLLQDYREYRMVCDSEKLKEKRMNIIKNEILALSTGDIHETCIENALRQSYREPTLFWRKYQSEVIDDDLFKSMCSKVGDMLDYDFHRRPRASELLRDTNEWLEAIEQFEQPIVSSETLASETATQTVESPMLSEFDKPTSSTHYTLGQFSSQKSSAKSFSRQALPLGLSRSQISGVSGGPALAFEGSRTNTSIDTGRASLMSTDSMSPRTGEPKTSPVSPETAIPVPAREDSYDMGESGDHV